MKKIIIPVLTAALCAANISPMAAPAGSSAPAAVIQDPASVMNGLSWGVSSADAAALLGQPGTKYTDVKGNLVLSYMVSTVYGLASTVTEYSFSEDQLVSIRHIHADPADQSDLAVENYAAFSEALTSLLGEPVYSRFTMTGDYSGADTRMPDPSAALETGDAAFSAFWQNESSTASVEMERTQDSSVLTTILLEKGDGTLPEVATVAEDPVVAEEPVVAEDSDKPEAASDSVSDGSESSENETASSDETPDLQEADKNQEAGGETDSSANTDFKSFLWGDSVSAVTDYEGTPNGADANDPHEYIYYTNRSVSGKRATLAYYFRNNELIKAAYILPGSEGGTAALAGDYKDIIDTIAARYGSPVSSGSSWDTDEHRAAFEGTKEMQALEQGFLTYETFWYTSRSIISATVAQSPRTGIVTLSITFQDADVFFGQKEITDTIYNDSAYPDGF